MASPIFDKDAAARILTHASLFGDVAACNKFKISRVTLFRYRKRLEGDPELKQVVATKNRLIDESWSKDANEALREGVKKLSELFKTAPQEQMRDVAGGIKILGDLLITQQAIDPEPDEEPEDEFQPGLDRQSAPSEKAPSADPLEEEDEDSPVEEA